MSHIITVMMPVHTVILSFLNFMLTYPEIENSVPDITLQSVAFLRSIRAILCSVLRPLVRLSWLRFLGAFAKFRKNKKKQMLASPRPSFRRPVYLSVRIEKLSSHWMDFYEILYGSVFSKTCRKNTIFIKIWQEWRLPCMKTCAHFWQENRTERILLRMRFVSDKRRREWKHNFLPKILPLMRQCAWI